MKYRSIRKNRIALCLLFLFFAGAVIFGALGNSGISPSTLFQLLMLSSLVAAIQITVRYLMTEYEYILDADTELVENNRITVIKIVGNKRLSVYTAPLGALAEVVPACSYRKMKEKFGRATARMDYCPDIRPREAYWLYFSWENKTEMVRIEADKAFAEALRMRIGIG